MSESNNNIYKILYWYKLMEIDNIVINSTDENICIKIKSLLNSIDQNYNINSDDKLQNKNIIKISDDNTELQANVNENSNANIINNIIRPMNQNFSLTPPHIAINEARNIADKIHTLDDLRQAVMEFNYCSLKQTATNTVFGEGVSDAKIMFIGEAPGATEDKEGRPFCGDSGKLLDKMLASIGLYRDKNFYITNTIFYRPPGNRQPTVNEIEICRPLVEKHIAIINPQIIVLVGSTAATSLIGPNIKITKIRKEFYDYNNKYLTKTIPVTAIFHPAYILRQPNQKKTMWYDLLNLQNYIEQKQML